MVTITADPGIAFNMYETGIASALSQNITAVQSDRIEIVRGTNYTENIEGVSLDSTVGIVNRIVESVNGVRAFVIDGLSMPVTEILNWGEQQDYQAFFKSALVGNDVIIGSNLDDRIFSGQGNDTVKAGAGDDEIEAGSGYNVIDGGDGFDTLVLAGKPEDYSLIQYGMSYILYSQEGYVNVNGVESFYFTDGRDLNLTELSNVVKGFDGLGYLASYADLFTAFGIDASRGAAHFAAYGFSEGRNVTFDGLDYIASYQDLQNAFGADANAGARHFIQWGFSEHRGTTFDGWTYLASYGDLIAAFGADKNAATRHYIEWGAKEGRSMTFDAGAYARDNPDLVAEIGNDPKILARYYVMYGYAEEQFLGASNYTTKLDKNNNLMEITEHADIQLYGSDELIDVKGFGHIGSVIKDWDIVNIHTDGFGLI